MVGVARGVVVVAGLGASWVKREEGEDWGRLGEREKDSSLCSSTGRSTANLCTPISMVTGSLGTYFWLLSALWRGLKATTHVRTTPCTSGEVLMILQSRKAEEPNLLL